MPHTLSKCEGNSCETSAPGGEPASCCGNGEQSTSAGCALVVPAKSKVHTLADLRGHSIGIAGGPLDKSWLILRAYAEKRHKMDLVAETEQVFGAPPLMFKLGISEETDAVINYWHFLAKMKAHGMREVISVAQATGELGLDPDMPLLGYVMKESLLRDNPGLAQALYDASRDAKSLLLLGMNFIFLAHRRSCAGGVRSSRSPALQ